MEPSIANYRGDRISRDTTHTFPVNENEPCWSLYLSRDKKHTERAVDIKLVEISCRKLAERRLDQHRFGEVM